MSGRVASVAVVLCGLLAGPGASTGRAQQDPAVMKGVQFLRQHGSRGAGESAMIALALLKADVPASDPSLTACLDRVKARFNTGGEYEPERGRGQGTYEAGASAMALANEDPVANQGRLAAIVRYLLAHQNGNGSWDYSFRTFGDTSITQYGVLGLWEAENSGVAVPPATWERVANWLMSTQCSDGGWVYHQDEQQFTETCAMTAAGLGSLLIAHRQLEAYREDRRGTSPLLKSLTNDPVSDFKPTISFPAIEQSVRRGMSWISAHFTTKSPGSGPSPYYMLYGIERMGALANRETIGRLDWFPRGREFLYSSQQANGSWGGEYGNDMNTCWAIFFLTRSTAKTLKRIRIQQKLGAGTLLGGRGLPKDLTSMTVAGGRVVSRPMNGAIEGMLDVLEDPRAEQADSAAAGLEERYYREGPDVLRPHKKRFRKMLSDRDPGLRRVAAWSLAHTGDMDAVPALVEALVDPDEQVVDAARMGLQVISRKIEGLGPPSPSTPEQRREAAARWRDWFNAIKPLDLDEDEPGAAPASTANGGAKP